MYRNFTHAFLLLFVSLQLFAQQPGGTFSMERLGTKDGLSHRWMMCVHQDVQGYFWLGTYDGLNRYDGNEFIVYRPSASGKFPVEADLIYQIAETATGKLYLATPYGILRFDPETAYFGLLHKGNNRESAIILNPERGVPFLETGISYRSAASLAFFSLLPSGELTLLSRTPLPIEMTLFPVQCTEETAWFWDFNGTYHRFDLKNKTWSRLPVAGSRQVPVDPSGNLQLPDGIALRSFPLPKNMSTLQWTVFNIEQGKAVWLYENLEKGIYKLLRYDLKNRSLETVIPALNDTEFPNNSNMQTFRPSHFLDAEGTVWYAGFLGLYKVRRTGNMFRHFLAKPVEKVEAPPSGISARQMAEDAAGNIYLRDAELRVYKINSQTGVAQKISLPPLDGGKANYQKLVSAIADGHDGFIWMYSSTRLSRYDPATGQVRNFHVPIYGPYSVEDIFDDGRGKIWIPGLDSMCLVDKNTGKVQQTRGWGSSVISFSVMLPEENTFWRFTDTGLVKINTLNFETRHIKLYENPREQRCLVSHRGWLWIGTSRGLEKVDPKTFATTNFDRSKGLPGNFVYSLVADGDYLWLGTSDGLCRFHVETGSVKNYFVEDGLSHNEFNSFSALKARNGRIYMGGLNGVNAFFPANLGGKTIIKPRILLSRFSQFDANKDSLVFLPPGRLAGGIELPPSVTSFNLHLALNSFIDPSKNQYAWRMDGLDEDWFYAGNQHIATYRHIPPGNYTFRAKAADSFGNWSEKELTLRITMLRPWYSRWWAWLLYSLLAGSATFGLYRFQLSKRMEHAENLRLQELDAFKNRFFTNITHEFRTPLTVILGVNEQLAMGTEQWAVRSEIPVVKGKLSLVRRNGESLLRLINQILDLAKLESHTLTINYVQGDVLPYLRYISESLHSFANAQNVMLRVESSETAIVMDYDPERLLQIVHNLLSNAVKFTPSGGRVTVKAGLLNLQGLVNLELRVTDTGVGIPPEDLPKIFDRFYQANNLEKAKTGGTGIGLSLTKELVKAMGGAVSVESEVGKGTTFTVRLPITRKAEYLNNRGVEELNPSSPESSNPQIFKSSTPQLLESSTPQLLESSTPQILLIEDNPDVVEYLAACLGENYRLDYAYNGRSGIEKALETTPDLILSDVMMPEKDGFEVCDFLKNDQRTSHIPIVLLTAKADVESRIVGLRRGADAYLAKPFHPEELLVTLQNLLELRRKLQTKYLEISVGSQQEPVGREDNIENEFLLKLRAIVEANLSDASLDVDTLCRKIGMGRTNLHNKLNALTGLSTTIYVRKIRLQRAKELLEMAEMNVSEIAFAVGFNDPKFFSRVFSEAFGMPPSEARKR